MATMTLDLQMSKLNVAETLPSVNFGFEELRDRMAKFTTRFDAFIEKERKRVLDERNQFRKTVADITEDQEIKKRDMEIASSRASTHAKQLAKETSETAEMHASIASISQHRSALASRRDALAAELAALQTTLAARQDAQTKLHRYLQSQARHNGPELQFWEDHLCMGIEGAGVEDRLRFVFSHICEKEWERTAWFELDTSDREYRVLKTRPEIEKVQVDECVERLNESRELGPFLKGMREIFVRSMK